MAEGQAYIQAGRRRTGKISDMRAGRKADRGADRRSERQRIRKAGSGRDIVFSSKTARNSRGQLERTTNRQLGRGAVSARVQQAKNDKKTCRDSE